MYVSVLWCARVQNDILGKVSRNDLGNFVEIKDMCTLRPAPSTEFQRGSCCSSKIDWGPNICKILPGCITTDYKTPMGEHVMLNYVELC